MPKLYSQKELLKKDSLFHQIRNHLNNAALENEVERKTLHFISTYPEESLKKRPSTFLTRLVATFYLFEKELAKRIGNSPECRHLLVRVLKIPALEYAAQGSQLGLVIVFNLLHEFEIFNQHHLLKAVRRILPGINEAEGPSYIFHDKVQSKMLLYVEIKRTRGKGFSSNDIKKLRQNLPEELRFSIERLSHPLFFSRNEEEIYKNIVQLSRELKVTNDLPQVMISFEEQNGESLCFTVIVLRVYKNTSQPWQEIGHAFPRSIRFILEQACFLGKVRNKYPKEAAVFTLQIESSIFLRKNQSIDLRLARDYLAHALKLLIGEFRDYNGSFLSKQNEQLEIIKNSLDEKERKQAFFVETLFYSLTPPLMQTLILPKAGKSLVSLFLDALKKECNSPAFLLLKQESSDFSIAVIKTKEKRLEDFLNNKLQTLTFQSYQFGHAIQHIDGFSYLCFLHQNPSGSPQGMGFLEGWLNDWRSQKGKDAFFIKKKHATLKINFQDGDPQSLNPQLGIDLRCRSLQKSLFEGLIRINPEGKPELAAAEKVVISSCKKHFVFKLRPHRWSNGEEVTAYDFERAWKNALTTSCCLRPDLFYIIKNARPVHLGQMKDCALGIKAIDANTLDIRLENPSPYFLEMLAHPLFFPQYEGGEEPVVFNGPFFLRSWKRDDSLSLIRNPYYWDAARVLLSGVDITIIRDSNLAYQMYQRGELDWIGDPFSTIPFEEIPELMKTGKLKTQEVLGVSWLYCNTSFYPLSSSKIRRALTYAINRQQLCDTIFFGHTPCKSPLPKKMSLLTEKELYKDGNALLAKKLFAEGMEELGLKGSFPSMTFYHSHITRQKELAHAICNHWQQTLGIDVIAQEKEWNALTTCFDKRSYHIGSCYRHFFYSDPFYIFNLFKEPTNSHNASGWEHKEFQSFVKGAQETASQGLRKNCLRQAEKILLEEMPVIPTHHTTVQYLTQNKLKGIHSCQSGDVDFKWVYFDE